jgi:hypothetical protein
MSHIRFFPHNFYLKILCRYWDLRQQNPAHTQPLPERCYTMSVRHPLMVVGTADRNILVYNLASPQASVLYLLRTWVYGREQGREKRIETSLSTIWVALKQVFFTCYKHECTGESEAGRDDWFVKGFCWLVVLHSNTNPLNPMIQTEFKRIVSPLKYQTRCVATFPDKQGFLVNLWVRSASKCFVPVFLFFKPGNSCRFCAHFWSVVWHLGNED